MYGLGMSSSRIRNFCLPEGRGEMRKKSENTFKEISHRMLIFWPKNYDRFKHCHHVNCCVSTISACSEWRLRSVFELT